MKLENTHYNVEIDDASGAIRSLVVNRLKADLIGEKRLSANFSLLLPLPGFEAHYIQGVFQQAASVRREGDTVTVRFDSLQSERGTFAISLSYTIAFVDDAIVMRASLTNREKQPVAEFWFPQLGGLTDLAGRRDGQFMLPGYVSPEYQQPFKSFPCGQSFAEPAEWSRNYPASGLMMPWMDLHDPETDTGLYFGYHDVICRFSTWHLQLFPSVSGRAKDPWLKPEEAAGQPVGLVFSHVRYPYIHTGETFDTGEFILRAHAGDWHEGSKYYRQWFDRHWTVENANSWLRKKSAWFTCILQTPEDRIVADYDTYDRYCGDAKKAGIDCYELIGWDKGGLERDYPFYVPEEKLGGRPAFRKLLKSIDARGDKCLVFANYNVLDSNTEEYKKTLSGWTHQDSTGGTTNWMSWGYSTLLSRKTFSSHRHVLCSIVPEFEKLLGDEFEQIVRDGAHGMQIDKVCVNNRLDFNPRSPHRPDEALMEGLIASMERIYRRLKAVDPAFCLASEAAHDRMIPFTDVFYRCASGFTISPLRVVFPEWTACRHISTARDFHGVNGAVVTGAVICMEPEMYRSTLANPLWADMVRYLKEVERIRRELADIIFLGNYFDTAGAKVTLASGADAAGTLAYGVHARVKTGCRAIVVANMGAGEQEYRWAFLHTAVGKAMLHEPFQSPREVMAGESLRIKGEGVNILVEF